MNDDQRQRPRKFAAFAGSLALGAALVLSACGGAAETPAGSAATTTARTATAAATATAGHTTASATPGHTMPTPKASATGQSGSTDYPAITIDAADFSFGGPDTIPAGWVKVTMLNTGAEPHHAQFMRINDDATMEQVQAALEQSPEAAFQFVTFQGGPAGVIPGGTSEVYVDLPAGQYLLVCFLPSPDGVPHVAKGMIMPVTVTESTTTAAMPATDTTITFDDFAFVMPDTLAAGHHNIEVVNAGQQPHEMSVLKLADGATAEDVNAFFMGQTAGPPPFADFGGMQGIMPGATAVLSLNLEPGTYFASCMIPDPASGESHLALGMGKVFTVE